MRYQTTLAAVAAIAAAGLTGCEKPKPTETKAEEPKAPTAQSAKEEALPAVRLRGYGEVAPFYSELTLEGGAKATVLRFDTDSDVNAATAAGKFLADLDLSPGVTKGELAVKDAKYRLVTVAGGSVYTGFAAGKSGYVIFAESAEVLPEALEAATPKGAKVVTALKYPKYLDRFDRYGWGFYGFSGVMNMHGWMTKLPGGGEDADPADDMDFLQKYDFRFELWPKPANFDDNYSVGEWSELWWQLEEAKKRGITLGSRLYGDLPMTKETADGFERPAKFLQGGWMRQDFNQKTMPHVSWFNPKARLYVARQAQQQMAPLLGEEITSWMSPYGELVHDEWYNFHADYSESALKNWHENLRDNLKLSLADVSAMFNRGDKPFTSWDEVPIPEIADFVGKPGMILDLEGQWQVRPETTADEGLTGQWWAGDVTQHPWETMLLPGSIKWHKYFRENAWMVRDFEVTKEQLAGDQPIYLYSFAKMFGDPRVMSLVYLNGEKVGETGRWGVWDVRKLLKEGKNRVAIRSNNFTGRVFLSNENPSVYPYLSPERNKLWVVFQNWLIQGKVGAWEVALDAMREVEPNVPIKFMAPRGFGTDAWIKLATKYGGWPHFTGEGSWFFPWYKRYGFAYGLPGSSEMAQPQDDAEGMYMVMQRTFLAGLNSHDHVFFVQAATRRPDVKQWYEDHIAVLKQMGRYDIAGPQVVIFRSTNSATNFLPQPIPSLGESTRPIQSVWNWDIGRGALQGIGQSMLYIDDGGLADGKLEGNKVLFDGGNEIVTKQSLDAIEKWVKDGGTFVTLPFTGRCLPDVADTWPIQQLTGCTVKTLREPGKGTVTIEKDQTLLKELAGQSFPDAGSTKDYRGEESNILSTELVPSADCEVIARFENGEPAIVSRKLGKGRVITLGSAFFKDVMDVKGMWLPGDREVVFLRDLLNGIGQPSVNYTDDYKVLAQRFRTNNGLDDVVMLVSFADGDRTVTLNASFDAKPAKIYRVAMNAVEEITDFKIDGNTVTISGLNVPKSEVQLLYFRTHEALDAATYWWDYQRRIWQYHATDKVDFSLIASERWTDPTMDLKTGWQWTQDQPANDDWRTNPAVSKDWKSWNLDIFNAVGAVADKTLYATKTFTVPEAWLTDGGLTRLTAADWNAGAGRLTAGGSPWRIWLNGQLLEKKGFFNPEVGKLLRKGENTLAIEIDPPQKNKYIGVLGAVYLVHEKPPVETVDLAGEWTGTLDGQPVKLQFPGKGKAQWPTRKVMIPADWKDKYIVTYYAKDPKEISGQGAKLSSYGVVVNEREARRRHHHMLGNEVEVDITDLLTYGQENDLAPLAMSKLTEPFDWEFETIELRLYPKSEYRD